MTNQELDQLVNRINAIDGANCSGFVSAHVATYAPAVIHIDFDSNREAVAYAFEKEVAGSNKYAAEPPDGSRVVFRP